MSRVREPTPGAEGVLEELIQKAGGEKLVGLKLFAALSLNGSRLYEVIAFDPETRRLQVRDVETGKEPSCFGNPVRDFEVGLGTREPDDPIILLLEEHRIPVVRFMKKASPVNPTVPREAANRSPDDALRGRALGDVSERQAAARVGDAQSGRKSLPSVRDGIGRSPERGEEREGRARERAPSVRPHGAAPRRRRSPSSSSSESPGGARLRRRKHRKKTKRRRRSSSRDNGTSSSSSSSPERGRSRRAMAAQLEELLRDKRASGMHAELRRLQAGMPPEKKGLAAQYEMGATIQASPVTWGPRLALALCLGTILKAIDMGFTFLAEATFTFARQKCEDGGRDLTEKQMARIDAEIWEFWRKQRTEGEKMKAKGGSGDGANRNR